MTAVLPSAPPTQATAGDTWKWVDSHPDYPASDGWVVAFRIAGASVLDWDSSWVTTVGDDNTVAIPAASTAQLTAGRYQVTAEYSKSGERFTVPQSPLVVEPDPATLAPGATLHRAERELEQLNCAIDAMLAGKAIQYYQIGNRQVGNTPLKDLMALRDQLELKVAGLRSRGGFGRRIKSRFVTTSG